MENKDIENKTIIEPDDIENVEFEHVDLEDNELEDNETSIKESKLKLVKKKISGTISLTGSKLKSVGVKATEKTKKMLSSTNSKLKLKKEKMLGKTKQVISSKNFKNFVKIATGTIGIASIVLIIKGCADAQNNKKDETTSNNNSIVQDSDVTTKIDSIVVSNPTSKEETSKDELDEFKSIEYIEKDDLVKLLKKAEIEFKGIDVETEELSAFVVEVNKNVINSDLRKVLVSAGVISENEEINRQNYLNTIDKIRNAMINSYTIEIDPELVGMPEYDALIEELKANSVKVHVSNMVSENTKEYDMYKILDETYDKIGESKNLDEAKESYEVVLEYVNSENAKNMPNEMEEEIYKDLYKDVYDEITASKFGVSITELDIAVDYEEETEDCEKTLVR